MQVLRKQMRQRIARTLVLAAMVFAEQIATDIVKLRLVPVPVRMLCTRTLLHARRIAQRTRAT
jgi:hypothetical protein